MALLDSWCKFFKLGLKKRKIVPGGKELPFGNNLFPKNALKDWKSLRWHQEMGNLNHSHHQELIHQINMGGKQFKIISSPSWARARNSPSQWQDWAKGFLKTVSDNAETQKYTTLRGCSSDVKDLWYLDVNLDMWWWQPSCCSNMLSLFLLTILS